MAPLACNCFTNQVVSLTPPVGTRADTAGAAGDGPQPASMSRASRAGSVTKGRSLQGFFMASSSQKLVRIVSLLRTETLRDEKEFLSGR